MAARPPLVQVWQLDLGERRHRVEASRHAVHRVRWLVDDELVEEKHQMADTLRLRGPDGERLVVRYTFLGTPRRATLRDASGHETDLVPEPGSPAAAHEDRVLEHPGRYALVQGLGGVGRVVGPIVATSLLLLLARVLAPLVPDLPAIPWPDLPAVPWPDLPNLPRIPWPDLPDLPRLPGWLRWILDHAHVVVPVVVALVLARAEIRRRRRQEEERRARREPQA